MAAKRELGSEFFLNARVDVFGTVPSHADGIAEAIRRGNAYADAGADCLYAPMVGSVEQVRAIVSAVAPKPVNLLVNAPPMTVADAAALGVRRISVGGTLARTAWRGFLAAAREIADTGTFEHFEDLPDVNRVLEP
jgi:methylisocitrate lyase